jgi:2-keto-4-pentenoate hydratase/2-oxohepta-3-ene-1,7-dioic acid hydratase in catechol pathway
MVWPLAAMVSAVSTRCRIKMGDLLFTGDCGPRVVLKPGMRLTASLGDVPLLDVRVRL